MRLDEKAEISGVRERAVLQSRGFLHAVATKELDKQNIHEDTNLCPMQFSSFFINNARVIRQHCVAIWRRHIPNVLTNLPLHLLEPYKGAAGIAAIQKTIDIHTTRRNVR